jgi:hypothetical protein
MHLIEDHADHPFQGGIGLQHPQEHPGGDHQEPGALAPAALETHAVAHPTAHRLPQGLSQALGRGAGRQAAGLDEHQAIGLVKRARQGDGNPGGFSRSRGRLQEHRGPRGGHGLHNRVETRVNRQGLVGQKAQRTWRIPSTGW